MSFEKERIIKLKDFNNYEIDHVLISNYGLKGNKILIVRVNIETSTVSFLVRTKETDVIKTDSLKRALEEYNNLKEL